MRRSLLVAVFGAALTCAAAVGALQAQPAAALGFVDLQVKPVPERYPGDPGAYPPDYDAQ